MDIEFEKKKIMEKYNQQQEQIRSLKNDIYEIRLKGWRELLGPRLDDVLKSSAIAVELTRDPDSKVREGALCVLADYWPPNVEQAAAYRTLSLHDSSCQVRCAAIRCLKCLYKGSRETLVSKFLASIANQEANECQLRGIAYVALLDVQGAEVTHELIEELAKCTETLPGNLNWSLVESFL